MAEPAENLARARTQMERSLNKLQTLPTLPSVVYELNRIINNPMSSATDVTKVMEKDQSLAAKVLRLVNSAYYGIPGGIANLQRAISYLGFDTVNQLVLTATVFQNLNRKTNSAFNIQEFWKHAIGTAMASETVAKWAKFHSTQECFSAGLLHDLGKVALYLIAPEYLDMVASAARQRNLTFIEAETILNTVPHTTVGSMLAKLWKLPPVIEATILHHHQEDHLLRGILKPEVNKVIDIVALANGLLHEIDFGQSGYQKKVLPTEAVLSRAHIDLVQLPLILKDIERNLETAEDFLKVIA